MMIMTGYKKEYKMYPHPTPKVGTQSVELHGPPNYGGQSSFSLHGKGAYSDQRHPATLTWNTPKK